MLDVAGYSRLGVFDLAEQVRSGAVTGAEVRALALKAADRVEPQIHAIDEVYENPDANYDVGDRPSTTGTLQGVPTFRKDLGVRERGRRYELGSAVARGNVSDVTDEYWLRLRLAGAVSVGRSRTAELGAHTTVEPDSQAPVANPWNPHHSSGGSSGGAAALVAAGVVPFAHANDAGGSIRIPAAYCGLVGLKPSRGAVPRRGDAPTTGVVMAAEFALTRSVDDAIGLFEVLADQIVELSEPEGLRVGVSAVPWLDAPLDAEIRDAVLRTATHLAGAGHAIDDVRLELNTDEYLQATLDHTGLGASRMFTQLSGERDPSLLLDRLNNYARLYVSHGFGVDAGRERAAEDYFLRVRTQIEETLERFDLLVTPVVAMPAPRLGEIAGRDDTDVAAFHARRHLLSQYTAVFNMSGSPAISIPAGLDSRGLPLAVQVVARHGDDARLLTVARAVERMLGRLIDVPLVHASL
ncbi:amidase [Diaminobutyricimonas sp. TR449]|uniref:amidase n=1 Tax=Diaminobutyricimonas sp. TR449 TaxID=2708076 RepID=UPI0014201F76|nr:amidase [Diaminobutyricimonas sp. TR449]